jgi:ABC-type multidrug transport system ATPase subunit
VSVSPHLSSDSDPPVVQATIRTHLKDTTMLIIAHRINTVIDASRILLLEDGHLAEYDTPAALLDKPDSKFAALVQVGTPSGGIETVAQARHWLLSPLLASLKGLAWKQFVS